jgi:uncharacterized membrane protein YgcG
MRYFLYELAGYKSLRRMDLDVDPVVTERWDFDKKQWLDSPGTIAATGLGDDCFFYKEISVSEAEDFQKRGIQEGGPTSGNYGHAGRPGEVGGSAAGGGGGVDAGGGGSSIAKGEKIAKVLGKVSVTTKAVKDSGSSEENHKLQLATVMKELPLEDIEAVGKIILTAEDDKDFVDSCWQAGAAATSERLAGARGTYITSENAIVIRNSTEYEDQNKETLLHEIGHAVWHRRLSLNDQGFWNDLFEGKGRSFNAESRRDVFPTEYSCKNVKELFAECYKMHHAKIRMWKPVAVDPEITKWFDNFYKKQESISEGSASSGNYGHAGRPGEVGGSGGGGGGAKTVGSTGKTKTELEAIYGKRCKAFTPTDAKRIAEGVPIHVLARASEFSDVMKRIEYALAGPDKVDKPVGIKVSKDTVQQRQGRCFEIAARFVMDNQDWTLVHATLYPRIGPFEDKIFFHGFAENGKIVYVPIHDKFFDRTSYYKYYSITDERKYDGETAIMRMLNKRNYGPWD